MSSYRRPNWPGLIAIGIGTFAVVVPLLLALASQGTDQGSDTFGVLAASLVGPVYALTAALIIWRLPSNSVAWMMMAVAVGIAIAACADLLTPSAPPEDPSQGLLLVIGLGSASWVFFIFPILHILLTFPTGRVLSTRWRPFVGLEVVMVSYMLALGAFAEIVVPSDESWSVQNPIGFLPVPGPSFWSIWQIGLLILTVGGLASVVIRFVRSRGIGRQQMKVLVFAVGFFAVVYGTAAVLPLEGDTSLLDFLLPVAMVGIGIAIAIALLRYRLYEIDRVVSRTVSYALVVTLLVGAVALVATLVGTRFESPVVVAATTLVVAAVFNPLRHRVQNVVDRRFNRSRYDVERVMDEFAGTLRDRVDVEGVLDGWVDVVSVSMQPSSIGVWVRT